MEARDEIWRTAERLEFGPSEYRTSFRALWNEEGLYLRFDAVDPAPWNTMTERDDPIWDEEVVEIFLDLDGSGTHYAEVELSPNNVVCDVRMIRGMPDKEMDLSYDLEGLMSRVHPFEREDRTIGWTGVLFLPWQGFRPLPSASGKHCRPSRGTAGGSTSIVSNAPKGPKSRERGPFSPPPSRRAMTVSTFPLRSNSSSFVELRYSGI